MNTAILYLNWMVEEWSHTKTQPWWINPNNQENHYWKFIRRTHKCQSTEVLYIKLTTNFWNEENIQLNRQWQERRMQISLSIEWTKNIFSIRNVQLKHELHTAHMNPYHKHIYISYSLPLRYFFFTIYIQIFSLMKKKWATYLGMAVKHHNNRSFYWKFIARLRICLLLLAASPIRILYTHIYISLFGNWTLPLIAAHYAKYCQSEVIP